MHRSNSSQNEQEQYNRLFVLGGKGSTEDEWREAFDKYGTIKDIWIVKDRSTNEEKGICYITMSKASEAALAIEEMNGCFLPNNAKPLKVLLASSRREGNSRDPKEEEKMLRIFIMVPKTYTKEEIQEKFEEYGSIDYVKLLTDQRTNKSKGLAFVKYNRAYHAALALEQCDPSFKAVFANTQKKTPSYSTDQQYNYQATAVHGMGDVGRTMTRPMGGPMNYEVDPYNTDYSMMGAAPGVGQSVSNPLSETALEIHCCSSVSEDQMRRLLDLAPGLQYAKLDPTTGLMVAYYTMPSCAAYAKSKLAGFEYPPGFRLSVRNYIAGEMPLSGANTGQVSNYEVGGDMKNEIDSVNQTLQNALSANSTADSIQMLATSLRQATELIQKTGLTTAQSPTPMATTPMVTTQGTSDTGMVAVRYCNFPLPTKKPYANRDSPVEERLFIVSQPEAFSEDVLQDALVRFGSLVDAYFMPGKNFGYAKFACKENAMRAVEVLHGQTVCNMRLKVMLADPPRYGEGEGPDKKRTRSS